MRRSHKGVAVLASCTAVLAASTAHAANPPCDNTGLAGTVIYVGGSSAAKPMLKQVSGTLAKLSSPIRVIYQSLGSCAGLTDITTDTKESTTGVYWDESNNLQELSCDPPQGGSALDVAVSDVFPTSCTNITLKGNQQDNQGSAQVFMFITSPSSKENVVSEEAAFVAYGWGGNTHVVDPWNDNAYVFLRDPAKSGTYSMLAKLLALDPAKEKGTIPGAGKTPDIVNAVHAADSTKPDASIGVVSADYGDANRSGNSAVKILAYQDKGAACGFYPDSGGTTFDKINVRTGLYPFWGPIHFIADKSPKAEVATLLSFFTREGLSDANKKQMIDNEVAAFTVPQCAMKVKHTAETSPGASLNLTPYDSPEPCGCYYEFKATGTTSCTACTDDGPCGGGKCRYGYCEAK